MPHSIGSRRKLGGFKIDDKEYEFPIICIMRDDLQDELRTYIDKDSTVSKQISIFSLINRPFRMDYFSANVL